MHLLETWLRLMVSRFRLKTFLLAGVFFEKHFATFITWRDI